MSKHLEDQNNDKSDQINNQSNKHWVTHKAKKDKMEHTYAEQVKTLNDPERATDRSKPVYHKDDFICVQGRDNAPGTTPSQTISGWKRL